MKNSTRKKILIIAPHQDDEVIGCGGLICHARQNDIDVDVVHVFAGTSGVAREGSTASAKDSCQIRHQESLISAKIGGYNVLKNLGFIDRNRKNDTLMQTELIKIIRKVKPIAILLPHIDESDMEHHIVSLYGKEAAWLSSVDIFSELGAPTKDKLNIFYYEVWTPILKPTFVLDITKYIDNKKAMLMAFVSQMDTTSWVEGSIGHNAYRGATQNGNGYVEAFTASPIDIKDLQL